MRHWLLAAFALQACGRTEPYRDPSAALLPSPGDAGVDGGFFDAGVADAGTLPAPCPNPQQLQGELRITADNQFRLWFDGVLVDSVPHPWNVPQRYPLTLRIGGAVTVIAIEATNTSNQSGLDRGAIADLTWAFGGRELHLLTDAAWRVASTPPSQWERPGFDDSGWPSAAVIAAHGAAPWGKVLGVSAASWLWNSIPDGAASAKPVLETVALRRAFRLDATGAIVEPASCR